MKSLSFPRALRLLCVAVFLVTLGFGLRYRHTSASRAIVSGVQFRDAAPEAGIDYTFRIPGKRDDPNVSYTILQTIGSGCGFLDYDRDGNLDILLVGQPLALYRGDGRGKFADVTKQTALAGLKGHFLGCAVGDYDNDGYPDLYISGYGTGRLLHNRNGKRFADVTERAGLAPQPWGTSCGWADFDRDGRLDLLVANYVRFCPQDIQICSPVSCSPEQYDALKPTLYRNEGDGRFRDVSEESGIRSASGKGLAVGFADYDDDGRQDIMIANDLEPGDLLHNLGSSERGPIQFENVGVSSGTAFTPDGKEHGGMAVDWADYDNDSRLDAFVTTFINEPKSLYRNDGDGLFSDTANGAQINATAFLFVAFGAKWLDYDNDGWPDLVVANGHIYNNIARIDRVNFYRQPLQGFHNRGAGGGKVRFYDESKSLGPSFQKPLVGRGLASGDYDNDGRPDLLVVDSEGAPLLLHNEGGRVGNWIGLTLVGSGRSNRDAIGARVTVEVGGTKQVKEVQTSGSYLSSSDPRLLFGLGKATHVDKITVRWPDGKVQVTAPLSTGRYHTVRQER